LTQHVEPPATIQRSPPVESVVGSLLGVGNPMVTVRDQMGSLPTTGKRRPPLSAGSGR
jgi:hypothetical protein